MSYENILELIQVEPINCNGKGGSMDIIEIAKSMQNINNRTFNGRPDFNNTKNISDQNINKIKETKRRTWLMRILLIIFCLIFFITVFAQTCNTTCNKTRFGTHCRTKCSD